MATRRTTNTPTDMLTVEQVCAELSVARSTFYDWRAKHRGPKCIRLPNGQLRIRRRDLTDWLERHEVVA